MPLSTKLFLDQYFREGGASPFLGIWPTTSFTTEGVQSCNEDCPHLELVVSIVLVIVEKEKFMEDGILIELVVLREKIPNERILKDRILALLSE